MGSAEPPSRLLSSGRRKRGILGRVVKQPRPDFAGRMRPLPIDRPPESLPPCDWLDEAEAPAEPASVGSQVITPVKVRGQLRRQERRWDRRNFPTRTRSRQVEAALTLSLRWRGTPEAIT